MKTDPLYITIEDNEYFNAYKIFDKKAFPEKAGKQVDACADDFALIKYWESIIFQEIRNNRKEFVRELHTPQFATSTPNPIAVLRYHSVGINTGVASFFVSAYSLLDKFARLVARLIIPKAEVGFSSLENWLSSNVREKHMNIQKRDLVIKLVHEAKINWLDEIIKKRVHITHYGSLQDLTFLQVPFSKPTAMINEEDIVSPMISFKGSRIDLNDLIQKIVGLIENMIKKIIALIPNVTIENQGRFQYG